MKKMMEISPIKKVTVALKKDEEEGSSLIFYKRPIQKLKNE